jgi:hypothetical protein
MGDTPLPSAPVSLPVGAQIVDASARGLTLRCPRPLPRRALLTLDLVLGARPIAVTCRVADWRVEEPVGTHLVDLEFVAMAQLDRDTLVDFLQAVGPGTLRVREHHD